MKKDDAVDSLSYFYNSKMTADLKEQLDKYHTKEELIDFILDLAEKYNGLAIKLFKIKMLILDSCFYTARKNGQTIFKEFAKTILDIAEGRK